MIEEPPHIKLEHKMWDVKKSPADPTKLLLMIILTATTGIPAADVDTIMQRITKEGLRVYVTNNVETEMLMALRMALRHAEAERDHNRARADHFHAELGKVQARVAELEAELMEKRRTLGFLEQGLGRKAARA